MKDLEERYRSYKREKLKEYRVSRPSDITGGSFSSLSGTDFKSLMNNIKKRIIQGEKKNLVVKDELIKYWKKNSKKSAKDVMKRFNSSSLIATENVEDDSGNGE